MITHSQLSDYLGILINQHLIDNFGDHKAKVYIKQYSSNYTFNFEKNLHLMPDDISKFHGVSAIFVLSIFQTLKPENLSINILTKFIMNIYKDLMKTTYDGLVSNLEESPTPFKTFVDMTTSNPSPYDNEFFQQETIQADENGYHLNINRCLYFEIFTANNLPELGPILCEYDMLMANRIKSWVKFEREETIASGFNLCTFRYYPC